MTTETHINIQPADSFHGFDAKCVGSKVTDKVAFLKALEVRLGSGDYIDLAPGKFEVPIGPNSVSCGVGRRTQFEDDYVVRLWRGRADLFLKRERATAASHVHVFVYDMATYEADPQVSAIEAQVLRDRGATHVIVAVNAFAGPPSKLSPHRFVANLAGGNTDVLAWSKDEIVERAKAVIRYDDEWCVVAD
jgi:hypothetical protein